VHLYLPGPHRGVWNGAALSNSKEDHSSVESADRLLLTFWCAALPPRYGELRDRGLLPPTPDLFQTMRRAARVIAYDRDEAARSSRREAVAKAVAEGLDCYRIQFPKGMDANSMR